MKSRLIFMIAATIIAAVGIAGGVYYLTRPAPSPRACTMEARQCPDGSYVGRSGPNCEFAVCPSAPPLPVSSDCNGPGTKCPSGYTCIQKCGPPVSRVGDPPPGYYCESNELAGKPRNCPICLASNTHIATPDGEVNVKEIKIGMRVWSKNAAGLKVVSRVIAVGHADVPSTHHVVHLVLSDGREVWVSPDHPTAGGQPVGWLHVGDAFDDTLVRSADLVPYWDSQTYDLLPAGETGEYWANGILLGSTLFKNTVSR